VPEPTLGEAAPEPEPISANGDSEPAVEEQPKAKKKTRRGSRGGRNRRKKPAAAAGANGAEAQADEAPGDDYVPMSEWIDEVEPTGR
jgi:uncharacterized protein with LGFP repeats